jgi:hypothetical protein
MQEHQEESTEAGRECANCGHLERFHERDGACKSPEDGTVCPCASFEPV